MALIKKEIGRAARADGSEDVVYVVTNFGVVPGGPGNVGPVETLIFEERLSLQVISCLALPSDKFDFMVGLNSDMGSGPGYRNDWGVIFEVEDANHGIRPTPIQNGLGFPIIDYKAVDVGFGDLPIQLLFRFTNEDNDPIAAAYVFMWMRTLGQA